MLSVPLGLATAVFLNETRSRCRRPVRIFVDAMSGLPSVVAGLFIFAVLIIPFANTEVAGQHVFGFNGFMAALALSPIMMLRPSPGRSRSCSDWCPTACARPGWPWARRGRARVWSVVLPTARTGMATAVVLGIARAVGETAPLLFTAVRLRPASTPTRSTARRTACRCSSTRTSASRPRHRSTAASPAPSC